VSGATSQPTAEVPSSQATDWQPPGSIDRVVVAHRVVQLGILLTLLWKVRFFVWADGVYSQIPLYDPFFPSFFRSLATLRIAFLGTVFAVGLSLVTGSRYVRRAGAVIALLGTSILCVHQASYNDMTFVTAWWASVWTLWYVFRIGQEDQDAMLRRAALLSRMIVSVILLGGAAGKWTGEYWSGEVLYDIYFVDRDFWFFNLLRASNDEATLRTIATWYSRQVILVETIAGLGLWLLPPRWAAAIAVILLASIALLSNFLLFSVVCSLIGLASVGFFVRKQSP
jgi:hypothetical protein